MSYLNARIVKLVKVRWMLRCLIIESFELTSLLICTIGFIQVETLKGKRLIKFKTLKDFIKTIF